MKYLKLDNLEISIAIADISKKIIESNYHPEVLISIGRGGMILTRYLSDILGVKEIGYLPISMYTGVKTRNNKPKIGSLNISVYKKNVLLIDDIVDTGVTIEFAIDLMRQQGASTFKTAAIICRDTITRKPSYYHMDCDSDSWVIFPWEHTEFGKVMNDE